MDNWLNNLSNILEESSRQEDTLDREFQEKLGEPDSKLIVDDFFEYGFWNMGKDGLLKVRKFKNGYSRRSAIQITTEELKAIADALSVSMEELKG